VTLARSDASSVTFSGLRPVHRSRDLPWSTARPGVEPGSRSALRVPPPPLRWALPLPRPGAPRRDAAPRCPIWVTHHSMQSETRLGRSPSPTRSTHHSRSGKHRVGRLPGPWVPRARPGPQAAATRPPPGPRRRAPAQVPGPGKPLAPRSPGRGKPLARPALVPAPRQTARARGPRRRAPPPHHPHSPHRTPAAPQWPARPNQHSRANHRMAAHRRPAPRLAARSRAWPRASSTACRRCGR
jgi:hypothetical protein